MLTSSSVLAALEDKARLKQQALEERERKKLVREEKKKVQEEQKKQKAMERTKKAIERAKKVPGSKSTRVKRSSVGSSSTKRATDVTILGQQLSETIDTNVCCMCLGMYEDDALKKTGADWIACACGRWLHEDCAEDCVQDDDGNDRCCSFCLSKM